MSRFLMLVSARADARLRDEVRRGTRPCPEYLRLEDRHGVELLDWSQLGPNATRRSKRLSVVHVTAALRKLHNVDAVFSDGEHVGVPLAVGMRARRLRTPHLMLGHHLTTASKRRVFRILKPQSSITRLVVHSRRQMELAVDDLHVSRRNVAFVQYGVDCDFWAPRAAADDGLVVSVGREHRDYKTLALACDGLPTRVYLAAGSMFSPTASHDEPVVWPDNFEVGFAAPADLRNWYARASVVVVPLLPNDFQAGVTVILEAMAMGKAVIVTATAGQPDLIENGITGVLVPPRDPRRLRDVIDTLLSSPRERRRLGDNARRAAIARFSLDVYADTLAGHLQDICATTTALPVLPTRDQDDQPYLGQVTPRMGVPYPRSAGSPKWRNT